LNDVSARVAGLAPAYSEADCRAEKNEVTLTCAAGKRIELSVIDAVTHLPVSGARGSIVRIGRSGFTKVVVTDTDADGHALLGPLSQVAAEEANPGFVPSETMVLVQHPRYGDYSANLDPEVSPLLVELLSGGELTGRVHWGGAVPTRLYMLSLEYRGADGFLEAFHLPRFTVTDLAGEFHVTNLLPGKYRAKLSDRFLDQDPLGMARDDFSVPTLHEDDLEIKNGETTQLVIDLSPSGRGATARIAGHVRLDGHNLVGAEVHVRGNESLRVETDGGGRFETVPFSVRGKTWISVEGDVPLSSGRTQHAQLYQQSIELAPDELKQIDLDLYPLTIRVHVLEAGSSRPVPEANVSANATEGPSGNTDCSTNPAGEAELLILEPGDYVLTASADGFGRTSSTVKVSAQGLSEPAKIELPRSVPCVGRVVVDPSVLPEKRRGFAYLRVQGVDNGNSSGTMLKAPDYTFTLDGLAAGKYNTWIYLGGQQSEQGSFELGADGEQDLVLTFNPAQTPAGD